MRRRPGRQRARCRPLDRVRSTSRRAVRETAPGSRNVSFMVADAQTDELPGRPFDVATSKLGVMFFDDPAGAFANIRVHLRAGRQARDLTCFQTSQRNPWHTGAYDRERSRHRAAACWPGRRHRGRSASATRLPPTPCCGRPGSPISARRDSGAHGARLVASGLRTRISSARWASRRSSSRTADAAIVAHLAQFEVGAGRCTTSSSRSPSAPRRTRSEPDSGAVSVAL